MKILVADDEPLIRRSLEKIFTRLGHTVLLAEDGTQAVSVWRSGQPDAAILDVLMPGLTGPEVIAEIGVEKGQTPVILISAYTGDYRADMAEAMGADLFIQKPFDSLDQVVQALEKLTKEKSL